MWEVLPLGLHADGVQYTTSVRAGQSKSLFVISWNMLVGPERLRNHRYIFSVLSNDKLCNCGCDGFHSIQDLFRVFSWSMGVCAAGRATAYNHLNRIYSRKELRRRIVGGIPLAGLMQLRGDWEFLSKALRFRSPGATFFLLALQCDFLRRRSLLQGFL